MEGSLFEDVEIDPEVRPFERGSARGRSRWSAPCSYDFVDRNPKHASGSGWWREEERLAPSIGADGSEEATLASSTAARLARGTDSELHLVYIEPLSCYVCEMAEREPSGEGLPSELERAAEEVAESRLEE